MKIIYFDLETRPILGYAWQMWDTNLLTIEKDSGLMSFSWKIDDGETKVVSLREYTEKQMVKMLWKLFDEADVLCAQNGDRFDIKIANRLFVKFKLPPPSPYKTIDTLKIAKKYFRFDSNKLDNLAKYLLGESKIQTDMSLWVECMKGNEEALIKMEKYCKHDVDLLYRVYQTLKGWHTGHPNSNVYNGTTHQCPICSGSTQKRGFMLTRTGRYQRYQCTTCSSWSKGEKIKTDKVIS
jgi:DNA polymerase elongation subunit (family B)